MGSGCPDPLNPDTDGDLLLDGDEVASVPSTNPCAFDTDGDGLSDTIDPDPTIPSTSSGSLEDATRALADLIDGFDVGLFSGPNDNARKGRQNSMSSRVRNAANAIAQDDDNGAVATLTSILKQIDGVSPPPDWMEGSPEKTVLAQAIAALIVLLM